MLNYNLMLWIKKNKFLLIVLITGLAVRLILVGNPGFIHDIAFWKWWGLNASQKGINWTLAQTDFNYPSFYLYILWIIGKIYLFLSPAAKVLALDNFSNPVWRSNDWLFLFLAKCPSIIADLATAIGIWLIINKLKIAIKTTSLAKQTGQKISKRNSTKTENRERETLSQDGKKEGKISNSIAFGRWLINTGWLPVVAAFVYLFNPVVLMDGAWWGQTDSVGTAAVLGVILAAFAGNSIFMGVLIGVAAFLKLQMIIYLPLILIYFFFKKAKSSSYLESLREIIKTIFAATITVFIGNLPFILKNNIQVVISRMAASLDYFPKASMNAYNLWWLATGARGMQTWDRSLVWGIMNMKQLGMMLFWGVYGTAIAYLIAISKNKKSKADSPMEQGLLLSCAVAALAFFLLPTQIHERYVFPVFMFLTLLTAMNLKGKIITKNAKLKYRKLDKGFALTSISLIVLSTTTFINLHNVLGEFYPGSAIKLMMFNQSGLTLILAGINICLFICLFIYLLKQTPKWIVGIIGLIGGVWLIRLAAIPSSMYLSDLDWLYYEQDWGRPVKNYSVEGAWSKKQAHFLSSNYYYFNHGIGTHANSEIVWNLGRHFDTFKSLVGIDTESPQNASVIFEVWGDGKKLWQSGIMHKWDLPKKAEVNISGVTQLKLVINDAGDGINGDHADWLGAKLERR